MHLSAIDINSLELTLLEIKSKYQFTHRIRVCKSERKFPIISGRTTVITLPHWVRTKFGISHG